MSADEDGGFATAGNLIAGVERLHPALTLPLLPPSISLPSPLPSLLQSLLPSPSQALPSFGRKGCVGMGVSGGVSYVKVWGSYPDILQNAGGVGSGSFLKLKGMCALWRLWGHGVHALICCRMQVQVDGWVLKEGQALTQHPPSF